MWVTLYRRPVLKSEPLVTLKLQGKIALVSLNRPARHNALVPELLTQLLQALNHQDCQSATVVILRAEGRSFSTGGDHSGFQSHSNIESLRRRLQDEREDFVKQIQTQKALDGIDTFLRRQEHA